MFQMFDSRYLYAVNDFYCRSMEFPSLTCKAMADMLDERVSPVPLPDFMRGNSSFATLQRMAGSRLRLMQRLTQTYSKPAFGFTSTEVEGRTVGVQQETVFETPFCNLLHFKKDMNLAQPRLLMIAPMAGHYATLLRETVRDSLPYFDIYVTDWINARDVPISHGAFDMDSYIATLVRCFEFLEGDFHAMAICQSGVPAYAAVALLEDREGFHGLLPRSLTVMGSPIDTRCSPTTVNAYATKHGEDWFEHVALSMVPEGYPGERRLVYPGFMQLAAFLSMHPERHQKSITDAMHHYMQGEFKDEEKICSFYAEFFSVMDLTAEFFLQTVRVVFQEVLLPQGKMISRGRKVDAKAIHKTPLLAVEGELDDICGLGQTKAALDLATNLADDKKAYYLLKNAGHYGLFNGHRYHENVLAVLRQFIGKNAAKNAGNIKVRLANT